MERRKVHKLSIKYNDDCGGFPFSTRIDVMPVGDEDSHVFRDGPYSKRRRYGSGEELCNNLRTVNLRNLDQLDVPFADNIDFFSILNSCFPLETNIGLLSVSKLSEKYFKSFQTFIGKL